MDKNVMSAQMLEVSLLGVETVLRLERDAWSMFKWLRGKHQLSTAPSLSRKLNRF